MNTRLPNPSGAVPESSMTILAAIEEGTTVEHVMAMAIGHARAWPRSQLHLVSVIDMPAIAAATFVRETRMYAQVAAVEEAAQAVLDSHALVARDAIGAEVKTHLLVGSPVDELVRLATEIGAALLIVGTHDTGFFKGLFVGSVSGPLVHQAPCSVLLVRPRHVVEAAPRAGAEPVCADCLRVQGDSWGSVPHCERHTLRYALAAPGETSP